MTLIKLICGDCREVMETFKENSFDSIVTDPPYELKFMGKKWDGSGISYDEKVWKECLRVLKPGGYLLAFGGTRTYHRLACKIEDVGFELHPLIGWCYGSGFPKATNLSKMLDKAAGAEREVVGHQDYSAPDIRGNSYDQSHVADRERLGVPITAPATDLAKKWDGWFYGKQSLKPALEPICMAQKPTDGKMVLNVEKWGVGAVNVDGCRIDTDDTRFYDPVAYGQKHASGGYAGGLEKLKTEYVNPPNGRWPANLILGHSEDCECVGEKRIKGSGWSKSGSGENKNICMSGQNYTRPPKKDTFTDETGMKTVAEWRCIDGCPIKMLDKQSGNCKSKRGKDSSGYGIYGSNIKTHGATTPNDEGGASRFFYQVEPDPLFYCAKASKKERGVNNVHPTIKPLKLMKYLVRLVTPPGGTVLDPFAGSGTTLLAAKEENFNAVGIELDNEYIKIAIERGCGMEL